MPLYLFDLPLTAEPERRELPDDHKAWSRAVTVLGELLQDIDGALPRTAEWLVRVTEGDREVARITVSACLHNHKAQRQAAAAPGE